MRSAQESVHLIAATVGFISFFLLWLAVLSGLVLRNGWALTRIRHSTAHATHSTIALLGLCLGLVHGFAQLASPGGPVRLVDQFVPFLNPTDPIGIGVGTVALELMVATTLSVLVQRRLGYTRWRALHALTYVAFMLLVAHVLISGSDVGPPVVWGSVLVAWLSTVAVWITTTPWISDLRRDLGDRFTSRRHGQEIAVDVDANRCARFGFCEHEAPDVFTLRGDGRLAYKAMVSGDQTNAVLRAVEVCPARAITLNRVPTTVLTPLPVERDPDVDADTGIDRPTRAGRRPRPRPGPGSVPSASGTGVHRRDGGS
ncbi:ferric reductase-like transmembrane domain-containing protein [Micromonospora sp. NPDC050417]|uniref:ferric reductase-like transmembrane domain-containing protein n=1 Tax=Micromonospora sp. NPDC050417 TaxID=3364280 RepID=UPI0037A83712